MTILIILVGLFQKSLLGLYKGVWFVSLPQKLKGGGSLKFDGVWNILFWFSCPNFKKSMFWHSSESERSIHINLAADWPISPYFWKSWDMYLQGINLIPLKFRFLRVLDLTIIKKCIFCVQNSKDLWILAL